MQFLWKIHNVWFTRQHLNTVTLQDVHFLDRQVLTALSKQKVEQLAFSKNIVQKPKKKKSVIYRLLNKVMGESDAANNEI